MNIEDHDKIRQAAQIFVTRHGHRFVTLHGRWWRQDRNGFWTHTSARQWADHVLSEVIAFIPDDDWLRRQFDTTWGRNQILAQASHLLHAYGLPGPGTTWPPGEDDNRGGEVFS